MFAAVERRASAARRAVDGGGGGSTTFLAAEATAGEALKALEVMAPGLGTNCWNREEPLTFNGNSGFKKPQTVSLGGYQVSDYHYLGSIPL